MRPTLLAGTLICLLATSACGNAVGEVESAGLTGITVDAAGKVSAVSYVCRDDVSQVAVYRDRAGLKETDENEIVRAYVSEAPLDGLVTLDLAAPEAQWSPSTPLRLEPGKGYLISAEGTEDDSSETEQVYVKTDELGSLQPGSVYTTGDDESATLEPQSEADFVRSAKKACAA